MGKKIILIIMDGWAHGPDPAVSAIASGRTPFVDSLYEKYAHTELITHSEDVGLPEGQMGNSEVGHMNIGAGRVVFQELMRINNAIRDRTLFQNETLKKAFEYAATANKKVHLMGLVSNGGVHSHIDHLKAICNMAVNHHLEEVYIHAFTDGRDTDPKSAVLYLNDLEEYLADTPVKIASVIGRYYAMDRDKRWDRIKIAYDLLTSGEGQKADDLDKAIRESYDAGVTDEFLKPLVRTDDHGNALARVEAGDVVICFNFRTDRCRQLTQVLTQGSVEGYDMEPIDLHYVTMTNYDHTFRNIHIVFDTEDIRMTLGEALALAGKKQIRISETEKYPHVTFFFSGGRETEFDGEERILIPSPKVATYDLQPEMSAPAVTEAIVKVIRQGIADFICLNFANADMVGHTGDFKAAIRAVETVDDCVRQVVEAGLEQHYSILLTADHGNADFMINADGLPNTAHSMNPVPLFYIDKTDKPVLKPGKLGDIAPTILTLMGIEVPDEMTGEVLL